MTPEQGAVAVKSVTGAYTAAGAIGTFVVSLIGLIGIWVKFGPKWKEIAVNADEKFRSDLVARIDRLEATLADERKARDTEREAERKAREAEQVKHEAERATDRHRINNLSQCLDALLLLIEQDPSKAAEAATRVKSMREKQSEVEAQEKAAIHAAQIQAKASGAASAP